MNDDTSTYTVYRFYFKGGRKVIKEGLTLEEAQEHCADPESDSKTSTNPDEPGVWFDGYQKD